FEEESIPALLAEFEEKFRPLTDKERQEFQKPETLKRIRRNAKVHSLADPSQEVQEVLSRKGLGIAVISDPKKSIIIGSFPVVKLTFPGRTNLADPSVEVWLPISRDVVVGVAPFPNTEKLVAIANHDIRALNLLISKQSTIIAGPSRELISSLSTPR
ncbi:MAG: hypothetical protein HYU38_10830, partial [Candidatus Tectomicrobia bacterium]|nr:hypothetical protein [Candidatus Tectomicrobia bacterium]